MATINREALEKINKTNPTDDEKAAIIACDAHRTELILTFNKKLMFDQTMDDDTLTIMLNILSPKLLSKVKNILLHKNIPATDDIAITYLRYLNACITLEIAAANTD